VPGCPVEAASGVCGVYGPETRDLGAQEQGEDQPVGLPFDFGDARLPHNLAIPSGCSGREHVLSVAVDQAGS
jgi:hypothetical protein